MVLSIIDRLSSFVRALFVVCVMLMQVSCIYDHYEDVDEGEGLQFVIKPVLTTKVVYDGVHSAFENGEAIGCVIAEKTSGGPVFRANTKWVFKNNVLMLQGDVSSIIQRHSTEEKAEDGYVELLDGDMSYLFYFYYPYIDNSTLDASYPNASGNYLVQTPSSSNWKSFPLFVNLDQSSKETINNSDFLWVGYVSDMKTSADIRKSNATYPVSLEFSKKTATIDVFCDTRLENLRMKGRSNSQVVTRGCMLDLTTGQMSPYTSYGSLQYDNRNINSSHSGITPYELDETYRFILPAQNNFGANLSFKINGVSYDADLTRLTTLEEGRRYKIYIMSDDGSIIINDWVEDYVGDLVVENPRVALIDCLKYKPGEPIAFVGYDLDLVTAVRLPGVGDFTDFVVSPDNTRLEFILPTSITDGIVYLLAESGDVVKVGEMITVKPKITSFSSNPVNVNSILTLRGTDFDLVTHVIFAGNVEVPVTPSATEINVSVPVNAVDGYLKFRLINGETVTVGAEELRIADSPLCRITTLPEPDAVINGGEVLTVPVVNGNRLADVKINGESVTYELNGSSLSINIPKTADKGTVLTLVSRVDMVDYEVSYIIDCVPNRFVEEVIWTGSYSPGNQIFDSSVCNWGGLNPAAGRVILVLEFSQVSSGATLILQNGWWQDLPENTMFNLTAGQTVQEVEFTTSMVSNLNGTSNSLLIRGNGYTLRRMILRREM